MQRDQRMRSILEYNESIHTIFYVKENGELDTICKLVSNCMMFQSSNLQILVNHVHKKYQTLV